MTRLAILTALVTLAAVTSAQVTFSGVRCGSLTCTADEYCSPETDRCAPCAEICNKTNHNFDEGLCVKECLGFNYRAQLPDIRNLVAGVETAKLQSKIALIISCIALAVLVLLLVLVCLHLFRGKLTLKYLRQKLQPPENRVKHHPTDLVHHNPHAETVDKNEMKLDIKNPEPPKRNLRPLDVRDLDNRTSHTEKSLGATTPKTTVTNLSTRHPAEDTTLDYSYDNRALNATPPAQPSVSNHF